MMCTDVDNFREPKWDRLNKQQREEVLNRYIDWTGFAPEQIDRIVENIVSGRERSGWFDGVPTGWLGVTEHDIRGWLEFDKLPEEEQLREAARWMKKSMTLGGNGVMVHAKWEEMNERQRHDVVMHELGMREGSEMPYAEWEQVIKEELGYPRRKEAAESQEKQFPSPSEIVRDSGPPPAPADGGNDRGPHDHGH